MSSTMAVLHQNPRSGRWWVALDEETFMPLAADRELAGLREQVDALAEAEPDRPRRNPDKQLPPNAYGVPLDVLEQAGNWRQYWPPLVVSCGLGVNSTAVLVGFRRLGIVPNLIVFADTGSERPETFNPQGGHIADYYAHDRRDYFSILSDWLRWAGFPPITVVKLTSDRSPYRSLEEQCLHTGQLPSRAYGPQKSGCSTTWKGEVLDRFIAQEWPSYEAARSYGTRVVRVLGYDDGEADRERARRFGVRVRADEIEDVPIGPYEGDLDEEIEEDAKPEPTSGMKRKRVKVGEFAWWYPLQTWGWDRERCKVEITAEGLPVPPRSSCFFCPAIAPEELEQLLVRRPELAARIERLEANAQAAKHEHGNRRVKPERWGKPKLTKTRGLWGPGETMTEYIRRRRGR